MGFMEGGDVQTEVVKEGVNEGVSEVVIEVENLTDKGVETEA